MATPTKTLRLREPLRAGIARIAKRTRRSFSEVTQELLEEALRMRELPKITESFPEYRLAPDRFRRSRIMREGRGLAAPPAIPWGFGPIGGP